MPMAKNACLSATTLLAFLLAATAIQADETSAQKGSLQRTGTGEAATVAQATDEADEGVAAGAVFFGGAGVLGGGVAAGILLGGNGGDGSSTSTSTSTATSTSQ